MPETERTIDVVLDTLDLPGDGQVDRKRIVLQPGNWDLFDPFLMMAEDWFTEPGFDWHPHRGIETVTFVLSGRQRHADSTGTVAILGVDDAQWMTAGRGIIHQELADGDETVHSLQLWVNLPSHAKLRPPRFQNLRRCDMPTASVGNVDTTTYAGPGSVTEVVQPVSFVDVAFHDRGSTDITVDPAWRSVVYVLDGSLRIRDRSVRDGQVGISHPGAGSILRVESGGRARALVFSGLPIREPVVQHGPFVMNTRSEIDEAVSDYRNGRLAPVPT